MAKPSDSQLDRNFIRELPPDGAPRLNSDLRRALGWEVTTYLRIKGVLLQGERIRRAKGRGGAVALLKRKRRAGKAQSRKTTQRREIRSRVFVTHGHNDGLRTQVVDLLERVDRDPVVLQDQTSSGRTVIEKFEHYAECAASVVILSGDDLGGKPGDEAKPRGRQNVVLELGYFLGKLGRKAVVVLHDGQAEMPSDLAGLITVRTTNDWKLVLLKELRNVVPITGTLTALLDG
jgi:predicted nucleotide-binding protein